MVCGWGVSCEHCPRGVCTCMSGGCVPTVELLGSQEYRLALIICIGCAHLGDINHLNAKLQARISLYDMYSCEAALVQQGADGVAHPVCYHSAKFKKHQLNSSNEKETLAM